MIEHTVTEIAICTVTDRKAAETARRAAMDAVRHYPGFVRWQALTALDQDDMIADIVEWQDKAAADAAAAKVRRDPAFAPYMAAIGAVTLMRHFKTREAI